MTKGIESAQQLKDWVEKHQYTKVRKDCLNNYTLADEEGNAATIYKEGGAYISVQFGKDTMECLEREALRQELHDIKERENEIINLLNKQ